jgi:hypothetical protein
MTEYIDLAAARAFVEANYQGDPLLRHLYGTLLDKLPTVDAVVMPNGKPGEWRVTWNHDMLDEGTITHWMPMPKPPKEVE